MAIGHRSFAAGRQARAVGDGCFVWADNNPFDHVCGTPNSYEARATGGVIFTTAINGVGALTAGAFLNPGSGSWSAFSDERFKRDFRPVDPARILAGVVALPVGEWSYVAQAPQIRHVGPTSQAFRAAFGLGENDTTISAVDAQGVALAAIQGLNAKVEATLADRDRQIALLRDALQALAKRIERTASP
jgi:hypothetical protein